MATGPDNPDTPLADPGSDRCSNCGAALATDQRYCVSCGERRGKPRFGAPVGSGAPVPEPVVAAAPAVARSRFSPGTTLVAGVATLLLAMGVGVLIGENGAGPSGRQVADQSPQVIKLNYGGAGATSGGSGSASGLTSTATHSHSSKSSKHAKSSSSNSTSSGPTVIHITKKVQTQMKQALNNVVGTNSNVAPPTTQVGGKCSNGQAGCQGGKFTGNFFGGG